jgi:murein DD-endopeptidase MepM/ murein hydrolase activator NlpD
MATSGEAGENFTIRIEHLLLILMGFLLIALASCYILFSAVVSGLGGVKDAGFRSGAPTAFAVADIPEEYLPVFLRAQEKYGVSWAVLAAICRVETEFGKNVAVSEAGAIGLMQFMPATFEQYKQDGDSDGVYDPHNPRDAIYSAANMLKAGGFSMDPRGAIFNYNHANWYVNKIMDFAAQYSSMVIPVGSGLWPLPAQHIRIESGYGTRRHPIRQRYHFHDGIDIPAPGGTPVKAVQDGRVDWDREKGEYGLCVVLDHGGCRSLYAHLSGVTVKNGDVVKAGQVIGYVGSTGLSTGPHLHFSVYVNGQPCNPEEWLAAPSGNS